MSNNTNGQYEVLSPWAKADPVPLKGLTALRLPDLAAKKIGLYCNVKRAAPLIMDVVEKKLKEISPTSEFSRYMAGMYGKADEATIAQLEKWLKEVDTVILAVGD
jgi:hypothetical protein